MDGWNLLPTEPLKKIKWDNIYKKTEGLLTHSKCSLDMSRSYHSPTSKPAIALVSLSVKDQVQTTWTIWPLPTSWDPHAVSHLGTCTPAPPTWNWMSPLILHVLPSLGVSSSQGPSLLLLARAMPVKVPRATGSGDIQEELIQGEFSDLKSKESLWQQESILSNLHPNAPS